MARMLYEKGFDVEVYIDRTNLNLRQMQKSISEKSKKSVELKLKTSVISQKPSKKKPFLLTLFLVMD